MGIFEAAEYEIFVELKNKWFIQNVGYNTIFEMNHLNGVPVRGTQHDWLSPCL